MRRASDLFLKTTLGVSLIAVCVIILITLADLVLRTAGAPFQGAADIAAYAMCLALVSAMPYVTREGAQIAVTLMPELLSPRSARWLRVGVEALAGVAALVICVLCIQMGLRQQATGVRTVALLPIPRWVISAMLAYGFAASGLMHLVNAAETWLQQRSATPSQGA
ncbi:MAG: TRAP transporter small permease [Pararhodobacter sp.]|nr:TRAP transporter small permease [Pararhodobacter sp.]